MYVDRSKKRTCRKVKLQLLFRFVTLEIVADAAWTIPWNPLVLRFGLAHMWQATLRMAPAFCDLAIEKLSV